MQPIKKINIILFSLFLCLGNQTHAMEELEDQAPKQTRFIDNPRQWANEKKEWAIKKIQNAKNSIGKSLFENGNISKDKTVLGYNIYQKRFESDKNYTNFRDKLFSTKHAETNDQANRNQLPAVINFEHETDQDRSELADKDAQELADAKLAASKAETDRVAKVNAADDSKVAELNALIKPSDEREESMKQALEKIEKAVSTSSKSKLTPEQIAENRAKAPKLNPARAEELQRKREQAEKERNENLRRIVNDDKQKKAQAIQELMDEQEKDEQDKNEILNESEKDRRSRISDQEANDFNHHLLQFQTRIGEQRQKENTTQKSVNRAQLKAEENSEQQAIQTLQDQIKTKRQKETTAQAEKLAQEEKAAQELQQELTNFQQKSESDKQSLVSGETNARTSIESEESNVLKSIEAQIAAMKQKEIILDSETRIKSINSSQEADLETLRQNMLSEVTQLKQAEEKKAKDLADANKSSKIDPMIKTIERNLKTPAELAKDKAEKEAENKKTISRRNKIIEDISNAKVAIRIAESHNSILEKTIANESLSSLNELKQTLLKSAGTLVSQSFKPFSQTIDNFSEKITKAEAELVQLNNQIKEITDNLDKLSSMDNSSAAKKTRLEKTRLEEKKTALNKKISGLKTAQQSSFEAISSYIKTDFPFDYQAKLNKLIEESQAKKPISKVDKIKLIEQMIPQIKNLTDDKKELISNLFYPKVSRN